MAPEECILRYLGSLLQMVMGRFWWWWGRHHKNTWLLHSEETHNVRVYKPRHNPTCTCFPSSCNCHSWIAPRISGMPGGGANLVGFNVHVHEGQPAGVGMENNLAGSYKPKPSGRIFWEGRLLAFNSSSGVSLMKNNQWGDVNISGLKLTTQKLKSQRIVVSYVQRQKLKCIPFVSPKGIDMKLKGCVTL